MAAGGTVVIYGGLTLYNVLTRFVNQEIAYDDSGTDALAFKFTVNVTGFIHGLSLARMGILPSDGTGDAGANAEQIRYLFAPRQHFEYRTGVTFDNFGNLTAPGAGVLVCDPAPENGTNISGCDVNNGPKPHVFNIVKVKADALIQVDVEFEIWMVQCNAAGTTGNNSGVLNNRWAVVDDIDRNFMTTRTFTGKMRLASSNVNANNFRNLVVPPLQQGMRREHMQFAVSEDNLNLAYSITDKEVAFAPPKPATSWSSRFAERKEYEGQLGIYSDAEITLGGDRYVDKQKLFSIAASMALSKFQNGVRLANDNTYYVQNIAMVDEYTDDGSFVHLRATARRVDNAVAGIIGLPSSFLGKPLDGKIEDVVAGYDSRFSRDSRPGDTIEVNGPISLVGAFAAYLQGPCQLQFGINQGIQAVAPPAPGAANLPTITAVTNNGIADDNSISGQYGTDNSSGMYEYWVMETHDEVEGNRAQMPVASTGTQSQSGSQQPVSLGQYWIEGTTPPDPSVPTSVVVDLANPTTIRHVTGAGERVGMPPSVPRATDHTGPAGESLKVASASGSRGSPRPTADGKYLHRVEFNYSYFVLGVVTQGLSTYMGLNPWSITPVNKIAPPNTPNSFGEF